MNYVVLDTDVASLIFRKRLPAVMGARLVGRIPCVTFVTVAEMTQWSVVRDWAPRNQAALENWLSGLPFIDCGRETARTWGHLSAAGKRRGRTHPMNDTWIAASCLSEGLPLATLNVKDFADNHGLVLIGDDRTP
jgi:predicted nucleic acid-binding protein